jgi:hypothetical protein
VQTLALPPEQVALWVQEPEVVAGLPEPEAVPVAELAVAALLSPAQAQA